MTLPDRVEKTYVALGIMGAAFNICRAQRMDTQSILDAALLSLATFLHEHRAKDATDEQIKEAVNIVFEASLKAVVEGEAASAQAEKDQYHGEDKPTH